MPMAFVKIHDTILDSSIWGEDHATRIVWVTMLAMADADGIVQASVSGLARRAVVSTEECEAALAVFLGPDPDSRDGTTGERLEKVPGGWLVLNHSQYRDRRTLTQIQTAERVRRHRERKRAREGEGDEGDTRNDVTAGNELSPPEAEAEAEAEADQETEQGATSASRARGAPAALLSQLWDWYESERTGQLKSARKRGMATKHRRGLAALLGHVRTTEQVPEWDAVAGFVRRYLASLVADAVRDPSKKRWTVDDGVFRPGRYDNWRSRNEHRLTESEDRTNERPQSRSRRNGQGPSNPADAIKAELFPATGPLAGIRRQLEQQEQQGDGDGTETTPE